MFKIRLAVRDYECDMQGIVNNAVYQNYLEHARHEFLVSKGVEFGVLVDQGIHAVLVRIEIDFKHSLRSRDQFDVSVSLSRFSRIKVLFDQTVVRVSDNTLIARAKAFAVLVGPDGKLQVPDKFIESLGD